MPAKARNTSMWVGDPTNMENGLDTVPFRLMKNPVILPGDKTRAYELQEMLQYKTQAHTLIIRLLII